MHSCVTSSGLPCHGGDMGLDGLQRSFPTLLWFCDFSTALWRASFFDVQGLKVLCVIMNCSLCSFWVTELQTAQLARENFSACCLILRCTLGTIPLLLKLRFLQPWWGCAEGFEQLEAQEG